MRYVVVRQSPIDESIVQGFESGAEIVLYDMLDMEVSRYGRYKGKIHIAHPYLATTNEEVGEALKELIPPFEQRGKISFKRYSWWDFRFVGRGQTMIEMVRSAFPHIEGQPLFRDYF